MLIRLEAKRFQPHLNQLGIALFELRDPAVIIAGIAVRVIEQDRNFDLRLGAFLAECTHNHAKYAIAKAGGVEAGLKAAAIAIGHAGDMARDIRAEETEACWNGGLPPCLDLDAGDARGSHRPTAEHDCPADGLSLFARWLVANDPEQRFGLFL